MGLFSKGSKAKQPVAPDPAQTAATAANINRQTAITEAGLNRYNQYGPGGSSTFSITGYNPDGTPIYAQTTSYSPENQRIYDAYTAGSRTAAEAGNAAMSRASAAFGVPFDTSGFNPLRTSIGSAGNIADTFGDSGPIQKGLDYSSLGRIPGVDDYGAEAKRVQDAVYGQATSRLDPQWEATRRQLASTLAAKGVAENSEAYRRAMDQASRQQADAYNQANFSAIQQGGQEQSRLFGLALSGRQQGAREIENAGSFANAAQGQQYEQDYGRAGFGRESQAQRFGQMEREASFGNDARARQFEEADYLRNMPLNEAIRLREASGGLPELGFEPRVGTNVADTDYAGLVSSKYNADMQAYQAAQQRKSSALGSIFGTVGSLASKIPFSDRRLKHHINAIGRLANGIKTYVFSYHGDNIRRFGVMADEVLPIRPEAVTTHPSGYLMVDYGKVW